MNLKVKGQNIIVDKSLIVSSTINLYEAEFEFDESWDGFAKTAIFAIMNGSAYSVVLSDDKCKVPAEVLANAGYIMMGVYGTKGSGDSYVRKPTIYTSPLYVDTGVATGTIPTPPTPSVYEQLITLINSKSSVSVSATGTATDEVHYITIDGVEKKLAGGGGGGASSWDDLSGKPLEVANGKLCIVYETETEEEEEI